MILMNLRTQIQWLYFLWKDREYFCTFVYTAQGAAEMKLRIQIFPMIFLAFPGEERVRWARGLQMAEYLEIVLSSRWIYNTKERKRGVSSFDKVYCDK